MGTTKHTTAVTQEELHRAQATANDLGNYSTPTINSKQFVFFAAFDGTNNIASDPSFSGDTQTTSVGQLWSQYAPFRLTNPNANGNYYAGVGTPGTNGATVDPFRVTAQINATAELAYKDFERQATKWLAEDPSRTPADLTTSITAFSRGCPSGVVFSQILDERGITVDGVRHNVPVSGMLLTDPVSTGFRNSLAIPENVNPNNIAVIRAQNEWRVPFAADDYSKDGRVHTFKAPGNHGDSGDLYDNGLGALYLQGSTQFFQKLGQPMADVPTERKFNDKQLPVIHDEGSEHWYWPVVPPWERGERPTKSIDAPEKSKEHSYQPTPTSGEYGFGADASQPSVNKVDDYQDILSKPLSVHASVSEINAYAFAALMNDDDNSRFEQLNQVFNTHDAIATMAQATQMSIAHEQQQQQLQTQSQTQEIKSPSIPFYC